MSKIGGGSSSSQTKTDPWDGVKPYLAGLDGKTGIMPEAERLYREQTPKYYEGDTYARLNDTQNSAIGGMKSYLQSPSANAGVDAANSLGSATMGKSAMSFYNPVAGGYQAQYTGMGDLFRAKGGNVAQEMNNPYLSGIADTIARKATSNYENSIAPQIRSSAQAAGQFGGSRQGVIEANALKDLNQGISDSLTNLYGSAYDQAQNRGLQMANMALQSQAQNNQASNSVGDLALRGLLGTGQLNLAADSQNFGQQLQGVGLLNQANQNQIGNYQSLLNLGGVQQQDQQNQINADMARWDYNQTAPWQALQNYMGLITGAGGRYGEGQVGSKGFNWSMDFTDAAKEGAKAMGMGG